MTRKEKATIIQKTLVELFPGPQKTPLNHSTAWELFVAVVLSAQCTDERVNIVTKNLFQKYPDISSYAQASRNELEQDIRSTGFYRSKAKAIQQSARIIQTRYDGNLPNTMDALLMLPGVGRKTANVLLGHVHNTVEGIAVDTHVRRLARKYGLTKHTDPNRIEKDLMKLFPKDSWWQVSYRLKAYGRAYSPARKYANETDPLSKALKKAA